MEITLTWWEKSVVFIYLPRENSIWQSEKAHIQKQKKLKVLATETQWSPQHMIWAVLRVAAGPTWKKKLESMWCNYFSALNINAMHISHLGPSTNSTCFFFPSCFSGLQWHNSMGFFRDVLCDYAKHILILLKCKMKSWDYNTFLSSFPSFTLVTLHCAIPKDPSD